MPPPSLFTDVINAYLPEPESSLINGIVFGVPLNNSTLFYDQIKRVGLLHIVVLSGMNISLLSGIVTTLTCSLGKKLSILISMLTIIIFVAFVGIQAPILRAAFMAILTSVGTLFGKRTITLYLLFISAACMIMINPAWIKSISFQLSYAATLGMLLFAPKTKPANFIAYCITDLRISLAAQVFTVPIIFLAFRQVSLIAPFANLLISWTIAPVMVFGLLAAFLGKIHMFLGALPAYICFSITRYIVIVIRSLSCLPWAFIQF